MDNNFADIFKEHLENIEKEKEYIKLKEKENSGTSWTRNEEFDRNGYLVLRNIINPEDFYTETPKKGGSIYYQGSLERYNNREYDNQVFGSFSRYNYPPFREKYFELKDKIEKIIGRDLYETYYFDRIYFPNQELKRHVDRESCEISVTMHVRSNFPKDWPIWIKTPDIYSDNDKKEVIEYGKDISAILNPGDAMLYKGCERPHWRETFNCSEYKNTGEKIFYHQIFFHYVLSDGIRSHFAYDKG